MTNLKERTVKLLLLWEEVGKFDSLVCPVFKRDLSAIFTAVEELGVYNVEEIYNFSEFDLDSLNVIDAESFSVDDSMTGIIITRKEITL